MCDVGGSAGVDGSGQADHEVRDRVVVLQPDGPGFERPPPTESWRPARPPPCRGSGTHPESAEAGVAEALEVTAK